MGKMLIPRIYVLVMTVSYTTASDSTNKWVLDHDFQNNLDTSQLLWDKNGISLLTCGSLCNMNPSCKSFFYHPSLNKCLGSQSYKRGLPIGQSMQQGWNYYTTQDRLYMEAGINGVIRTLENPRKNYETTRNYWQAFSEQQQCDGDYKFSKSLGLCFKIHPEINNFFDAMDACEAEGAKLIIIRNAMELSQVQNAIKVAVQISWPFIGLRRAISNGITTWKWWNGQIASYLDWEIGEPNNQHGNQDCVTIFQGLFYRFDDGNCLTNNSFICQKNI